MEPYSYEQWRAEVIGAARLIRNAQDRIDRLDAAPPDGDYSIEPDELDDAMSDWAIAVDALVDLMHAEPRSTTA